ncbi:peptidoglycan-binding protein [Stenotrophomonas sp. PS02297]|uniref:PGRP and LysM peptidoglycan-binding domain-containing protein n=1 Tax=Stenotrophomonas sp. PS02297 TaxID=2991423 RepID=UPI00249BFB11|nr:peptidoglycan-binding protein [Stenotrophomonas sp. PS02297]
MSGSDQGAWHTVSAGEGIAAIAKKNGYLWKTLWEHGNNSRIRSQRPNPNQLVAGDKVFLPPKGRRQEARATDARHSFRRKGEPTRLKLQLTSMGEPRGNEPYTLVFADTVITGSTDGQGRIDQPIPGEVATAMLTLNEGREQYPLTIGLLEPVEEPRGVQQRLLNLGYDCGGEDGQAGAGTRAALLRFQAENGLQQSGEMDGPTRDALRDLHV